MYTAPNVFMKVMEYVLRITMEPTVLPVHAHALGESEKLKVSAGVMKYDKG